MSFLSGIIILFFVGSFEQSFASEQGKSMVYMAVDKQRLIAELRTWSLGQEKSEVLSQFPIAIGKERGDKEKAGDNRTPEGIYFTQSHIDATQLPAEKYGPKAVPLNFPNPFDLFQKKTGYGIWLHGAGNDDRMASATVTEGCVAFFNKDIKKLSRWLTPFQAAVVISKDIQNLNKPDDVLAITLRTQDWLNAWSRKNISAYIEMYHPNFNLDGRNREEYQIYKERLFEKYTTMHVQGLDIRVLTHEKYAVSAMNQNFTGNDSYVSNGRKILYWVRDSDGKWRILRESFGEHRFEPLAWSQKDLELLLSANPMEDRSLGEHQGPVRATTKSL